MREGKLKTVFHIRQSAADNAIEIKEFDTNMNMIQNIDITDSEWEVMRVLWSQEETTSSQIVSILEEKMSWKPTTVKTLIARLVKKNLVSAQAQGNRYLYKPMVTETQSWRCASEGLFGHICAKKMGNKIAGLIQSSTLSHADIAMLGQILKEKSKTAVDVVSCDCVKGQCNCESGTCSVT